MYILRSDRTGRAFAEGFDLDGITAVFAHNLAKISLARAMGNAEARVLQFLLP
jgi:hypothetical protein